MLRNKALTEKVALLGIDGMDPRFSRKLVDEGKMPNLKKLIEKGSARKDLRLLGAVPTITPPMWATLATGAYPMTHGIEDFFISPKGDFDFSYSGFYSISLKAEPLWDVTAEAGKKTLVWHWPGGSWPPTSDSENLMVVDGTSAGALGYNAMGRDMDMMAVASTKAQEVKFYMNATVSTENFSGDPADLGEPQAHPTAAVPDQEYYKEYWNELKEKVSVNGYTPKKYMDTRSSVLMPGKSQMERLSTFPLNLSISPVAEPQGWSIAVPDGAKEFTILFMYGFVPHPCLALKNEDGVYDRVALYMTKESTEPYAVLVKDEFVEDIIDFVPKGKTGDVEKVTRCMKLMDISENCDYIRVWISPALSIEDKGVWYPQWIFDKIMENVGYPVPTDMLSGGDMGVMFTNIDLWKKAAKWQADSLKYMIHNEGVEVIFSHFHGPDLAGHMYMPFLKNRENSPHPEEEFLKLHEATYMMTDEYIGEFLPLIDEGWTLMVFSDHSLLCREHDNQYICDNYGINVGIMSELGYLVMKTDEQGNMIPEIDWEHTRAVQTRANSIFINLKGRDRHGIVDPVDKYELEEQIITDLYGYKDKKTGKRIVALAWHQKDANLLGLGGPHASGDIVMFLHDDYAYDHGESLSTAEGYADTSVGPIFVAAGPGIKEGYEMELFPREVDVAPTAAVLLGVRIPAQCEGCPSYSILTEEL